MLERRDPAVAATAAAVAATPVGVVARGGTPSAGVASCATLTPDPELSVDERKAEGGARSRGGRARAEGLCGVVVATGCGGT